MQLVVLIVREDNIIKVVKKKGNNCKDGEGRLHGIVKLEKKIV